MIFFWQVPNIVSAYPLIFNNRIEKIDNKGWKYFYKTLEQL